MSQRDTTAIGESSSTGKGRTKASSPFTTTPLQRILSLDSIKMVCNQCLQSVTWEGRASWRGR